MLRNKMARGRVILLFIIIAQLLACIWIGQRKKGFFCDEIYSYGLANSENYSFLDYNSSKEYGVNSFGWVDADYFKNYVEADDGFSLSAPIKNQINDVHPPFYYILLHAVCSAFPNTFSKWTGIGLNLAIMLVVDVLLYYIALYFFKNDYKKAALAVILWGFSAAGISNILFIRMYLLLTAEMLFYIAIHIHISKGNNKLSLWKSCLLCSSVIMGGLTHYYFYPFAFCFSAPICLWMLYRKNYIGIMKYAGTLLLGFAINLAVFPATLKHVFGGYRGKEVIKNMVVRDGNVFLDYYLEWINNSMFGGLLKLFLVLFALKIIYKIFSKYMNIQIGAVSDNLFEIEIKRTKKKLNFNFECSIKMSKETIVYLLTSVAVIGFGFVAIVGSQITSNRYIYPIYPMISIWIVMFLCYMLRYKIVVLCLVFVMCMLSIKIYDIDYRYPDYNKKYAVAKRLEGDDCLLYCYDDVWLDVYTALPLKFLYDETYFFHSDEIGNMANILNNRASHDDVVVSLPEYMQDGEAASILNGIIENTEFSSYEHVYDYYTQVYLLK